MTACSKNLILAIYLKTWNLPGRAEEIKSNNSVALFQGRKLA